MAATPRSPLEKIIQVLWTYSGQTLDILTILNLRGRRGFVFRVIGTNSKVSILSNKHQKSVQTPDNFYRSVDQIPKKWQFLSTKHLTISVAKKVTIFSIKHQKSENFVEQAPKSDNFVEQAPDKWQFCRTNTQKVTILSNEHQKSDNFDEQTHRKWQFCRTSTKKVIILTNKHQKSDNFDEQTPKKWQIQPKITKKFRLNRRGSGWQMFNKHHKRDNFGRHVDQTPKKWKFLSSKHSKSDNLFDQTPKKWRILSNNQQKSGNFVE